MIVVSACLAGIDCKWDGTSNACEQVIRMVQDGIAVPVCPEQLGGLSTPRIPAEQIGNKVVTRDGKDVTNSFIKGATEAFKITRMTNCTKAILKANSPSCGSGTVYDGTFTGKLSHGDGVFTKKLKENNIIVFSEKEIGKLSELNSL